MRPVLFAHGREFQPQSTLRDGVAHHRVRPDLPFLYQEMKVRPYTCILGLGSLDKQAAHAQIFDARDVVPPLAGPVHPYVLGRGLNSRGKPSGRSSELLEVPSHADLPLIR